MAPKKRKSEGTDDAAKKPVRAVAATTRVTRSSALKNGTPAVAALELPKRKKGKAAAEAKKVKPEVKEETENKNVEEKNDAEGKEEADKDETDDDESNNKTIVVEHCKQCNSFKTRAVQVKNGLKSAVPGINVVLNPDQPRKGCFEIREEGGETFISLQDMIRPFKPMKDLDMEKVISDVIEKIK